MLHDNYTYYKYNVNQNKITDIQSKKNHSAARKRSNFFPPLRSGFRGFPHRFINPVMSGIKGAEQ